MNSPFPPSTAAPGDGRIVVGLQPNGEPGLEVLSYQYPLKLIAPSASSKQSALVFLLSYGGGLVAGDQVCLDIDVRPRARLSLVTQGTTKVFKAPTSSAEATRQTLRMRVAPGAALCLLPDPVQPFADSVYEQRQVVRLVGPDASLCLLDWVTQGRGARGEDWSFTRWEGRNEVWLEDATSNIEAQRAKSRLLVRDALRLAPGMIGPGTPAASASTTLRDAMHGLAVVGTLILRGPLLDALGRFFLAEFAALPRLGARDFRESHADDADAADAADTTDAAKWHATRLHLEHLHGVLWSAAAVRGCVVAKLGARTVEGARLWLGAMLAREGSVAAVFGEEALMCTK